MSDDAIRNHLARMLLPLIGGIFSGPVAPVRFKVPIADLVDVTEAGYRLTLG